MINKAIQPLTTTDADVLEDLEDLDDIEHMAVELPRSRAPKSLRQRRDANATTLTNG